MGCLCVGLTQGPYAHERNRIVERSIQTIFDVTRPLLQQADMQQDNLWPVALRHAVYPRNRAPSTALGGRTPLQMLGAPVDSVNKLFTDDDSVRATVRSSMCC